MGADRRAGPRARSPHARAAGNSQGRSGLRPPRGRVVLRQQDLHRLDERRTHRPGPDLPLRREQHGRAARRNPGQDRPCRRLPRLGVGRGDVRTQERQLAVREHPEPGRDVRDHGAVAPGCTLNNLRPHAGRVVVATGGWSAPEWYPPGLPARERLRSLAERLDAVEIDSSFYALPALRTVEGWAKITPERFVFTAKLHRALSRHAAPLKSLPGDLRDGVRVTDRGS